MTNTKTRTLSSCVQEIASKADIDATDAGKAVRSYLRRNKDKVVKEWPALKDHEKGNRYPEMPVAFADKLVAGRISTLTKS